MSKQLEELTAKYYKVASKLQSIEEKQDDWSEALKVEGDKVLLKLAKEGQKLLRQEAVIWWDEYLNNDIETH